MKINLLRQLLTLQSLQVGHQDCQEFGIDFTRFYLNDLGYLCFTHTKYLEETPHIAVYRNGEVHYHDGKGRNEHVVTLMNGNSNLEG